MGRQRIRGVWTFVAELEVISYSDAGFIHREVEHVTIDSQRNIFVIEADDTLLMCRFVV